MTIHTDITSRNPHDVKSVHTMPAAAALVRNRPAAAAEAASSAAARKKIERRKLVVVGDGNCGKTSLLSSFAGEEHPAKFYTPTVMETMLSQIQLDDGRTVELVMWDTAGQEIYDALRPISYPNTDVMLVCYCCDDINSLYNVAEKWIPELRHFCPTVPIILVATKIDLRTDPVTINRMRKADKRAPISEMEGAALATSIGAVDYAECSALTGQGIGDVFDAAASAAMLGRRKRAKKSPECQIL